MIVHSAFWLVGAVHRKTLSSLPSRLCLVHCYHVKHQRAQTCAAGMTDELDDSGKTNIICVCIKVCITLFLSRAADPHQTCPVSDDIHPGSHLRHTVSALLSLRDGFGAAVPDWFLLLHWSLEASEWRLVKDKGRCQDAYHSGQRHKHSVTAGGLAWGSQHEVTAGWWSKSGQLLWLHGTDQSLHIR